MIELVVEYNTAPGVHMARAETYRLSTSLERLWQGKSQYSEHHICGIFQV